MYTDMSLYTQLDHEYSQILHFTTWWTLLNVRLRHLSNIHLQLPWPMPILRLTKVHLLVIVDINNSLIPVASINLAIKRLG